MAKNEIDGGISISGDAEVTVGGDIVGHDKIENVFLSLDFFGDMLNELDTPTQNAIKTLEKQFRISSVRESQNYLVSLRRILMTVLPDGQQVERNMILGEISQWVSSTLENYQDYKREHEFPYGNFCYDLIQGLTNLNGSDVLFTSPPNIDESGLVYLKITSSMLFGDLNLEFPEGLYIGRKDSRMIFPIRKSVATFVDPPKSLDNFYFTLRLKKKRNPNNRKRYSFISWLKNKNTMESWSSSFFRREIKFNALNDLSINSKVVFNKKVFATFIISFISDYVMLVSSGIRHDKDFNNQMKRLFGSLGLNW